MPVHYFVQTSSIINRLRMIMTVIAVFIIFCALALYLSSLSTFQGFQELKAANDILNLNTHILESLDTADKNIDEIFGAKRLSEVHYSFMENQRIMLNLMEQSYLLSTLHPEIANFLKDAQANSITLGNMYSKIMKDINDSSQEKSLEKRRELSADLLFAKKLILSIKDSLTQIQIHVKQDSDDTFIRLYSNRFRPLFITYALAVIFFIFVITFGLSISKKIGVSISNLLEATDKVGRGDLNYEVSVLEKDEIGRLTFAFNRMINSLRIGQDQLNLALDRTSRLQSITASFSEALTIDQVFDVIFKEAYESLKAIAASIVLVSEDKNFLELKRFTGFGPNILLKFKRFPISSNVPSAQVIRFGQPIFADLKELQSKFGSVPSDFPPNSGTIACLPLMVASESLGALTFIFSDEKKLEKVEKDFMLALARQCAQAIHRALLYNDAKKAIEARDEFLSIASHELRTPLTPLKLQVQAVARAIRKNEGQLSSERLSKLLETSDRQIARLSDLIDELLDVSRITSGKMILTKTTFSLKDLISEVLVQYTQALHDAETPVEFKVVEDTIGNWDKIRIENVIVNLITNAVKYAPKKTIHITLSKKNHSAKIEIRDEGPGIDEKDWERIFSRFERVSSKENVGGLGLGLYISKQIVEAHKGVIFVDSTLGVGSTFTIELPSGDEHEF